VFAQDDVLSLGGRVIDLAGNPAADVQVFLRQPTEQTQRHTMTQPDGRLNFVNAVSLMPGEIFSVDESWLSKETFSPAPRVETSARLKREDQRRTERETIEAVLAETRGRVSGSSGAAARLGISTIHSRPQAQSVKNR
jgi:transcriptional regulator with GAF, ATPase, and Fis domain